MKNKFSIIIVCISLYLAVIQPAFSSAWPIFTPPDKEVLFNLNYIETNQCPHGQGKLVANPFINTQQYLCKNFCPADWTWMVNDNGKCHNLSSFNFKSYEISHVSDEYGTSYSVITVNYGPKNTNDSIFKYYLSTKPGERWYCVNLNPDTETPLFSCANDMKQYKSNLW